MKPTRTRKNKEMDFDKIAENTPVIAAIIGAGVVVTGLWMKYTSSNTNRLAEAMEKQSQMMTKALDRQAEKNFAQTQEIQKTNIKTAEVLAKFATVQENQTRILERLEADTRK